MGSLASYRADILQAPNTDNVCGTTEARYTRRIEKTAAVYDGRSERNALLLKARRKKVLSEYRQNNTEIAIAAKVQRQRFAVAIGRYS